MAQMTLTFQLSYVILTQETGISLKTAVVPYIAAP